MEDEPAFEIGYFHMNDGFVLSHPKHYRYFDHKCNKFYD
jgi:hypothetical protein